MIAAWLICGTIVVALARLACLVAVDRSGSYCSARWGGPEARVAKHRSSQASTPHCPGGTGLDRRVRDFERTKTRVWFPDGGHAC